MELKPGYKESEIGSIPKEWDAASIGTLASFTSGKGISVTALRRQSSDFPIAVFGGNGIAGYTTTPLVHERTVVVGRVGQRCGEVYVTDGPAWISDNALYPRRVFRQLDMSFFALALQEAKINDVKNRNDLPLVTQSILHAVKIAWPSNVAEQRAIAAVIGDMDALISALDKLSTKKRDLKQATVQQLLTGQTRLPGFHGDWDVSTVGLEFEIQLGKMLDAGKNIGTPKPYIGNKAVQWNRIDVTDLPMVPMSRSDLVQFRLRKGDLLVCEGGEIGRAAIWEAPIEECYYQKALHRLRPLRGFDVRLMVSLFRFWSDCGLLTNFVTQTSIAHLTREKLAQVPMPVPHPDEQTAIATVLSDMDAEIAALEARRDKTRALKQGMMQELLTGRTRLV